MKDGLRQILGRQIAAVIVATSERPPRNQAFLVFTDGTSFEFYGDSFTCCGGVDRASGIEAYVKSGRGTIVSVYTNDAQRAGEELPARDRSPQAVVPRETLEGVMTRELAAWRAAKAAIYRAKVAAASQ